MFQKWKRSEKYSSISSKFNSFFRRSIMRSSVEKSGSGVPLQNLSRQESRGNVSRQESKGNVGKEKSGHYEIVAAQVS
jgi:hypothetical protein